MEADSLKSKRKELWPLWLSVFVFFATLPLYAWKLFSRDGNDFDVYYLAGKRVAAGDWANVYTLADAFTPFRYAPLTLLGFYPFAFFEIQWARVLWLLFGQALPTALGFLCLYRVSKKLPSIKQPAFLIGLTFLLTFRFTLSNYIWGQVCGLLFLGAAWALYGAIENKPFRIAAGFLFPSILKIGPGLGFLWIFFRDRTLAVKTVIAASVLTLILILIHWVWIGSLSDLGTLLVGWKEIVRMDEAYADASKYGSQSFLSFFLRLSKIGVLPYRMAHQAGTFASLTFIGVCLWIWWKRKATDSLGVIHSFSLILYGFLFAMKQTYSYNYILLAIPIMALLHEKLTCLGKIALVTMAFISLAGKDVVGSTIFFGIQHLSVPLYVTLLLYAATLQALYAHTHPRSALPVT